MLDVLGNVRPFRLVSQERLQVLNRVSRLTGPDQEKGQAIVGTSSLGVLLQDVPIRLGRFLGHPDPRIRDRDLLEDHRVAGVFLEGEAKGSEGVVELTVGEQVHALLVVIHSPLFVPTTEEFLPD